MEGRNIWRTCVDKLTINLIREQIKVILLHKVADLIHLLTRVEITCRIIRVADQNRLCALSNQLLKLLHRRKSKTSLDRRRYCLDHSSRRHRKRHIVSICRLRNDNLITRIKAGHKCKKHRLRTAGCHNDIIRRKLDTILRIVLRKLLAQAQETLARAILQHFAVNFADCIKRRLRRRKVRLTDVKMIYLDSACLCIVG